MLSPRHDKVVTAPPAMGHHSTPPRQKILLKKELLALTQKGLEAILSMIFGTTPHQELTHWLTG